MPEGRCKRPVWKCPNPLGTCCPRRGQLMPAIRSPVRAVGMKGGASRLLLRVSARSGRMFILNHGESVKGYDGATPSILHRRFLLTGNKTQEVWGCSGSSAVGKALFMTNERMLSCTEEALWMVYMRYIIVGMYYFLTHSDTFLILLNESISLKTSDIQAFRYIFKARMIL